MINDAQVILKITPLAGFDDGDVRYCGLRKVFVAGVSEINIARMVSAHNGARMVFGKNGLGAFYSEISDSDTFTGPDLSGRCEAKYRETIKRLRWLSGREYSIPSPDEYHLFHVFTVTLGEFSVARQTAKVALEQSFYTERLFRKWPLGIIFQGREMRALTVGHDGQI